jgi:hypothetical protein
MFRIGHKVYLNQKWYQNVYLDGRSVCPESESEIPDGTHGVVISINENLITIRTDLGSLTCHKDYLSHI